MGAPAYSAVLLLYLALVVGVATADGARPVERTIPSAAGCDGGVTAVVNRFGARVNSNSVLVALLNSQCTELVEKTLMLLTLEGARSCNNITIFAPWNDVFVRDLERFLLELRNLRSLQSLFLFHVLPAQHPAGSWSAASHHTLFGEEVKLTAGADGTMRVAHAAVTLQNTVHRPEGAIHGTERLLVPRTVPFNRHSSLVAISNLL
ncbi:fasciclin-like arabinogalactan protein 16 [Aegilops tauschii subsp. strangulata]|uniref:Fasciclin-like arabinogalactan protein 16 n=1 Tax=Aegilops tauschii TaxID=37682 RepID=M8BT42_AEGTA|nr:fasciclin-like arabinogalactan protein 16 [Aegilops tauschii subsp. strangulata]XP_044440152.1 fasciclin-like arabinogalactan protein 16 [Triticum aestivum]